MSFITNHVVFLFIQVVKSVIGLKNGAKNESWKTIQDSLSSLLGDSAWMPYHSSFVDRYLSGVNHMREARISLFVTLRHKLNLRELVPKTYLGPLKPGQ